MYKNAKTFEERLNETMRVTAKYPDRVPMIVERAPNSKLPEIDRNKWLAPKDMTVGQYLGVLRRRITLKSQEGLFVLVNNVLPTSGSSLGQLYEDKKDEDGFLYWTYTEMSTFG